MSTSSRPQVSPVLDATYGVEASMSLVVDVSGAHVRLRPSTDEEQVQVQAGVPRQTPDRAREILNRRGVRTHLSNEHLHVYNEVPAATADTWRWRRMHPPQVHLDLRVPFWMTATVRVAGGAVQATDLAGHLDLEVLNGSIEARGLEGPLTLSGKKSEIQLTEVSGPRIEANVAAGTVHVARSAVGSLEINSRAAPVSLVDVEAKCECRVDGASLTIEHPRGPCSGRVRGGSIAVVGAPQHETSLSVAGGSLQARLSPSLAADLVASGTDVSIDHVFSFEGKRTGRRLEGTLNGGGVPLRLRAVHGRVQCVAP